MAMFTILLISAPLNPVVYLANRLAVISFLLILIFFRYSSNIFSLPCLLGSGISMI